jgi:hypothetical protein
VRGANINAYLTSYLLLFFLGSDSGFAAREGVERFFVQRILCILFSKRSNKLK